MSGGGSFVGTGGAVTGDRINLFNRTRGTVLGDRILLADSWWSRARGFLGRPEPGRGEGILLVPCRNVHTFGMRFPLDLVFLDPRGEVVELIEDLPPGRKTTRVRRARAALELPTGTIDFTRTGRGDVVVRAASAGSSASGAGVATDGPHPTGSTPPTESPHPIHGPGPAPSRDTTTGGTPPGNNMLLP